MNDRETKKFIKTLLVNVFFWFAASSVISLVLGVFVLGVNPFSKNILWGFGVMILGNLAIFCMTQIFYFWKEKGVKADEIHKLGKDYLGGGISLRPFASFAESALYVVFFLVRPEIIVGYLFLKFIGRYRGDGSILDEGEAVSTLRLGIILSLLVSLAASVYFYNSEVFSVFNDYFFWLMG